MAKSTLKNTLLFLSVCFLISCGTEQPDNIGLHDGQLSPCPESPNCVQTFDPEDKGHYREPLTMEGEDLEDTRKLILKTVESMPRTEVIVNEGYYIHVTYTTPVFRFIDDVEFLIDDSAGLVHYRSASRVGYSDLGVNSRRMKEFTDLYHQE
jgi:uncharacterized protein (DUF1499 family)